MLFGLCNAHSTFKHLMEWVFGDQQCQSLLLYLNDIVVFLFSISQHLELLEVVFWCLERENLKVNLEKCVFFQPEVRYLDDVISNEGVDADPSMIEVVRQWPRPSTFKELYSFLGFTS